MHDLNTINRLNYEAHARSIKDAQAHGKYVIAKYEGLTLVSTQVCDEAPVVQSGRISDVGERIQVFAPFSEDERAAYLGRDQSEDRKLAA